MADPQVRLVILADLEEAFTEHEHELPGRRLSRELNGGGRHVVYQRTAPGAPDRAVTLLPIWSKTAPPESRVQLDHIE